MRVINKSDIRELLEKAKHSERGRTNLNVHDDDDDVNFFYNAFIPGTYVQPHKHVDKDEYFQIIEGRALVVIFDNLGIVMQVHELSQEGAISCKIERGIWHTVIALEPSVLLEVKAGPYDAATAKVFAKWAPGEDGSYRPSYEKALLGSVLHVQSLQE